MMAAKATAMMTAKRHPLSMIRPLSTPTALSASSRIGSMNVSPNDRMKRVTNEKYIPPSAKLAAPRGVALMNISTALPKVSDPM